LKEPDSTRIVAAMHPDGKTLATSTDGTIKLWDLPEGKLLKTLPAGESK
jgi:WD40 repeat protein